MQACRFGSLGAAVYLMAASVALGQGDDRLVGIWALDEGYQTLELLFRSDGGYQVDTTSASSEFGPMTDRGRYEVVGQSLTLTPYGYFQKPTPEVSQFEVAGDTLTLTSSGSMLPDVYELKPGSRAEVLAREQANHDLVRRWTRHLLFVGDEEYTFRPGGYYTLKTTRDNPEFPPEFERGRYDKAGNQVTLKPYGYTESNYTIDIFGTTLTLIETNDWSGKFTSYEEMPGSWAEVTTKGAEAAAFLSSPDWQAGVWHIQDKDNSIDLLLRPDGVYSATNTTKSVHRVLRGRYTLANGQIHIVPFVGQQRYTLDDANFGIAEQTYGVDYYEGELQLIELKAYAQIRLAHKSPGSQATVVELARQAQAEREREDWYVGIWELNDAGLWMQFTFRPDNRYVAQSGATQVERGQYLVAPGKITLAPFAGNGPARGFELDLYDGELFLIGDSQQLVILRKIPGSETGVIEKTRDPAALKGERGSILGLWTANRPSESVELIFRPDGQFRLQRCSSNTTTTNTISSDYGLYTVDMATRTLVYDSRFVAGQTQHLDFYGDTMTIYGGLTNNTPSTYTVNLGSEDADIAASFAADAAEAQVNAEWLARLLVGPLDPNAVLDPEGFPSDPDPGQILDAPAVFSTYQFYRRLIPKPLYGTALTDTQQWHFFPSGRVLVRFTTWSVDWLGMATEYVTDAWGAYGIEPKPTQTDILHCYADNDVTLKLDVGDLEKLTLENGRRTLFWGKENYPLGLWATEQKPIACQLPGNPDASLINTGVSLSTDITPDRTGAPGSFSITIAGPVNGTVTISGSTDTARSLIAEDAASLASPIRWEPLGTNDVPAGPFSFTISGATNAAAFFRLRSQ